MTDHGKATPEMLEAMRQGEADAEWLTQHPGVLEPYRGEWVAIHGGRILAHSPDGRDVATQANARDYPGAWLLYVETREEAEAVHIVTPFVGPSLRDSARPPAGGELPHQ